MVAPSGTSDANTEPAQELQFVAAHAMHDIGQGVGVMEGEGEMDGEGVTEVVVVRDRVVVRVTLGVGVILGVTEGETD